MVLASTLTMEGGFSKLGTDVKKFITKRAIDAKRKAIRVTARNNQRKAPFSCRHATINNLQFDMQYELKKRMYRARSPINELKYACTERVNLRIPARFYRHSNIKRIETRLYRHATQENEWPIEITGSERHFLSEIGQQ